MSGHTPTVLEMTVAPDAPPVVVPRVLELLRRKYFAPFRAVHGGDVGREPPQSGPIILGGTEVFISVEFTAAPDHAGLLCPTVSLDSAAYEASYDVLRRRTKRSGRRALVDFCIAVSGAASVEAFRLRFQGGPSPMLRINELVRDLTSVDRQAGLLCGIALSSHALPLVRPYWPDWAEKEEYAVLVFL